MQHVFFRYINVGAIFKNRIIHSCISYCSTVAHKILRRIFKPRYIRQIYTYLLTLSPYI
jgi:hypothetical protein